MNGDMTKTVLEIGKRMIMYAICINFVTYGFKIFIATIRAKMKNKVGEAEQPVDYVSKNKKINPPSGITIGMSFFVTLAFAYALEQWIPETNPFNIWRYLLYFFTLFFVQTATYRTAVKSVLDLIPKITKKFLT